MSFNGFEHEETVGIIHKNSRARVRVSRQQISGKPYIDVRQLYYSEDSDSWLLTRKGIALLTDQAVRLRDALTAAIEGGKFVDPALSDDGESGT